MQNAFQLQSTNQLILITCLFIISSCSSLRSVQDDEQVLKQIQQIQLDGEGRGKISFKSQSHLFGFASLAEQSKNTNRDKASDKTKDSKQQKWTLEMDFSLHGSEYLIYKWGKTRWSVGGSFLAALRSFIKGSSKNEMSEREFNELLSFVSEALRISLSVAHRASKPECLKVGVCGIPKSKMLLKWIIPDTEMKQLIARAYSISSPKNMTYSLVFSNLKSQKYKLLTLKVNADQGFSKQKEQLALSLYFD